MVYLHRQWHVMQIDIIFKEKVKQNRFSHKRKHVSEARQKRMRKKFDFTSASSLPTFHRYSDNKKELNIFELSGSLLFYYYLTFACSTYVI